MDWLDSFEAVPTVGIRLRPNYTIAGSYHQLLGGWIDQHLNSSTKVEVESRGLEISLTWDDGIRFRALMQNLICEQTHPTAGSPPPYHEAMQVVIERLAGAASCLTSPREKLPVERVGVMAQSRNSSIPPGIQEARQHVRSHWTHMGSEDDVTDFQATIVLDKREGEVERCVHRYTESPDDGPPLTILDWQTLFAPVRTPGKVMDFLKDQVGLATCYFSSFAEGNI